MYRHDEKSPITTIGRGGTQIALQSRGEVQKSIFENHANSRQAVRARLGS